MNNGSEKFVVSQGDHIGQVLFKPVARPVLQQVPALAQMTRGSAGVGSTGTGTVVDDESSYDQEGPTMAGHSLCTCCHRDSSDHQETTIWSMRANQGMTHDHVHVHGFLAPSEELAVNEVQLPPCCCRAPSASAEKQLVRGIQQNSDMKKQDTGFQVPPDCFAAAWGLYREWHDQDSETIARNDTVAGSQLTPDAMLSESGSSEMTLKERQHLRRPLHRTKSDSRFSLPPLQA